MLVHGMEQVPVNHSVVPHKEVRDPVLLTLVLTLGHPLSLVPMRAMPAPVDSTLIAFEAATDLFCLSVLALPLVQDFSKASCFIALVAGQAPEPVSVGTLTGCVPSTVSGSGAGAKLSALEKSSASLQPAPPMLPWHRQLLRYHC